MFMYLIFEICSISENNDGEFLYHDWIDKPKYGFGTATVGPTRHFALLNDELNKI